MTMDFQLTGEGIAAILAIGVTGMSSVYATIRQIRADRKADERDKIATLALEAQNAILEAQNKALRLVADNQSKTHEDLKAVVETVAGVQVNVAKVELATNSMKDALVKTTAQANLLQGRNEGIIAEKARAGAKAESARPDGAPTQDQIQSAHDEQVKAVATDADMRVKEAETRKRTGK